MANLVIVESPTKATAIQKFLGKDYKVVASTGHIRDLPKTKPGVDIENHFEPHYVNMRGKTDVIKSLKAAAKRCDRVFLATDGDREGEAISWHIAQILGLNPEENNRITFEEITQNVVREEINHPRKIDMNLVNAQQARRILDRIVGYQISPLLWKKIQRGLSAGRVQSVAVRIVVDRENEIREFSPEEYRSIDAKFHLPENPTQQFSAYLVNFDGNPVNKTDIKTQAQVDEMMARLSGETFSVQKVKRGTKNYKPIPPFKTSTLQQEASNRLGFSPKRTMAIAQELFEGVDITGVGTTGLITYMRTDSLRISPEIADVTRHYIAEEYGPSYVPEKPNVYHTKKGAQDAHEAIRPTMPVELPPGRVEKDLSPDQLKLYSLIWSRFLASQMTGAQYDTISADIATGNSVFRATGSTVAFDGFLRVYRPQKDTENDNKLPAPGTLSEGQPLQKDEIVANQHFTKAPPRYTEASLIQFLEENGIGRPSTYAPTISTILSHQYVERNGKTLFPTELGETVTKLMMECFPEILNIQFTAELEKQLDEIESGNLDRVQMLSDFYDGFSKTLAAAETKLEGKNFKIPDVPTDIPCEFCGKNMVIKTGRYGKFLACSGYPECKNTKTIEVDLPGTCPRCGEKLVQRTSKKTGRKFYGCAGYPNCTFITRNVPTESVCPKCGKTLFQKGGETGTLVCENENCGYTCPVGGERDD